MSFKEVANRAESIPMYGILAPHVGPMPKVKSTRPHLKHKGKKNFIKMHK